MLSEVYLGLGSNLGDRAGNVARAVELVKKLSLDVTVSPAYHTSPQGFAGQPAFLNAVCRIFTRLDPFELLEALRDIEAAIGAPRPFPNGPRAVDLDILIFGRWVIDTPSLTIPHPRMAAREFVMRPLADIAPGLVHPVLGETVAVLLRRLSHSGIADRVVLLAEDTVSS